MMCLFGGMVWLLSIFGCYVILLLFGCSWIVCCIIILVNMLMCMFCNVFVGGDILV